MLVDLRVYTLLPARFRKFLQSYEEVGFALTSRYLGRTLGIFTSESGEQNRTFQFFMYDSSAHRDRCRAAMLADPEFHAFVKMDADALLQQMNTLLWPTAFSPIGGTGSARPNLVVADRSRVFELKTWTCRPDCFDSALALLATSGVDLFQQHAPQSIAYFVADTGNEQQILRLAAYDSGEDRDQRKALANADPDMRAFNVSFRPLLVSEESTLLLPTTYSPLR
jgi:uncharacterized protein YbaA (DUF1428 family)